MLLLLLLGGAGYVHASDVTLSYDAGGNLSAVTLSVQGLAPTITAPPSDRLGQVGGVVSFGVSASGSPALSYQWKRNGMGIGGATGATMLLENLTAGDFTTYTVVVSNGTTSVESDSAQLLLDSNESGMPDAWQLANFGDLLQPPGGDFDHDGVSNRDEYREGTNPTNSGSRRFALRVSPTGGGAVLVSPVQARYAPGTQVTLTAAADAGVSFLEWTGDAGGSSTVLSITMDQDRTVAANFGVSLAQAVDAPATVWSTSGDGHWHGLFLPTHDGVDAAVAPLLNAGQQSLLEGTIVGQGRVTFFSRLFEYTQFAGAGSGVADILTIELDSRASSRITSTNWQAPTLDWVQGGLYTTAGSHTLGWRHARDPSGDTSSIASVDEVQFTPIVPAAGMEELAYPLAAQMRADLSSG
jgi:hypothetical protein